MKVTKDTVINVGDTVRIKPLSWYEKNKNSDGEVPTFNSFVQEMSVYCGRKAKVVDIYKRDGAPTTYNIDICEKDFWGWDWEMFSSVTPKAAE
jgi:hypothetical protein